MLGFRTPWEVLGGEDEKLEGQAERVHEGGARSLSALSEMASFDF